MAFPLASLLFQEVYYDKPLIFQRNFCTLTVIVAE